MFALTLLGLALVIALGQTAIVPSEAEVKAPTPIGVIDGIEYLEETSYHYTAKQARDFCVANGMLPASFSDLQNFYDVANLLHPLDRYWTSGEGVYLWHTGEEVGADIPIIGTHRATCFSIYNGQLVSDPCNGLPENMYFALCARPATT